MNADTVVSIIILIIVSIFVGIIIENPSKFLDGLPQTKKSSTQQSRRFNK